MNGLMLLLAVAIGVLALWWAWARMARHVDRRIEHCQKQLNDSIAAATDGVINAVCINSSRFAFPVGLGGPSIDSSHARHLIFLMQLLRPAAVLELGSGSSTVWIAHLRRQLGLEGLHIAVDHEAKFLSLTREACRLNGVADSVEFLHCPLVQYKNYPLPWYELKHAAVAGKLFDLILVDGPPAYLEDLQLSRYPALPELIACLSGNGVLILDDANRVGEATILEKWRHEFPELNFELRREGKGMAVISRRVSE